MSVPLVRMRSRTQDESALMTREEREQVAKGKPVKKPTGMIFGGDAKEKY
jgi:hypothetical protein